MRKFMLAGWLCFILSANANAYSYGKQRVAVIRFDISGVNYSAGNTIMEDFITTLVNSNKVSVVERNQIETVLKEQGFQLSGFIDPDSAVKVGKILGVEKLIMGLVSQLGFL